MVPTLVNFLKFLYTSVIMAGEPKGRMAPDIMYLYLDAHHSYYTLFSAMHDSRLHSIVLEMPLQSF